jgi:hypothetical protein
VELQTARRKARSPSDHTPHLAEPRTRVRRVTVRAPVLALVAVVVVAAVGYGAAAQLVSTPLVNPDELRYTLAARAVADGGWPNLRDHGYGYGPLYPIVLAPLVALSGSVEAAYPLFKLLNALLFALTAVPVYFLARRLLSGWWSLGVAAASVAIPSSIYTSLVMTESISYLIFGVALLAVVLALERPSVPRQLAMVGAIVLACATRIQFAALVPAFLGGALLLWSIDPLRPRARDALARLWPTLAASGLGIAVLAARLVRSASSPETPLGGYGALWRGYDPFTVAKFAVYHLAAWEIYLFVVPVVVMPIVVAELLREARRGGAREGAFVAALLTVTFAMLVVTAAFASSPYGYSELHDRYLFYVAPLWLTGFAVWLSRGLPRPVIWAAVGAALGLVLPAILPFGLIGGNIVFEEVPTALWSWVWTAVNETPHLDGRRLLALTVMALTVAAVALPRRFWPVLPALVAVGLVLSSAFAWHREIGQPADLLAAPRPDADWVDDAVAPGGRVTKLYLSPPDCPQPESTRQALFLAEFFNTSVDRAVAIGDSKPDGLPVQRAGRRSGGRLVLRDGKPLVADYVVAHPDLDVDGRPVAEAPGSELVLWKVGGVVRLADDGFRTLGVEAASDCG